MPLEPGRSSVTLTDTATTLLGTALFFNINGVANSAIGYYALWNNDSDALGSAKITTRQLALWRCSTTWTVGEHSCG
jgi:hypothetical protein